jgi:hypothetical protein
LTRASKLKREATHRLPRARFNRSLSKAETQSIANTFTPNGFAA